MAEGDTELSRSKILGIILVAVFFVAVSIYLVFVATLENVTEEGLDIVADSLDETRETQDPVFGFQRQATGFEAPVDLEFGNGQLYVVEQAGLVKQMSDGRIVLDIRDRVKATANELGLLGMVFEPGFESSGDVYLNYTREGGELATNTQSVISRFEMSEGVINPETEEVVLTIDQPYNNHNAGDLVFGDDGHLYIPTGDGGSGGDPENYAQNIDSLLGKVLRIDVIGQETYVVPEDNPFVGQEGRDEIWTYGWRNPWRMSFDPSTGNAYVGDVGQKAIEEISVMRATDSGRNYGWRCLEGTSQYDSSGCDENDDFVEPFAQYEHTDADRCSGSVTGGYVYRGQDYKNFEGMYIFADFCTGVLYRQSADTPGASLIEAAETDFMISTFGVDDQGEVYFADLPNGTIYKLIDTSVR